MSAPNTPRTSSSSTSRAEPAAERDVRLHLWVSGKVQGVHFRVAMEREARRRGVRGWVRNLPDGRVEAVAEGPEQAVELLLSWCRQGPPGAIVTDVDCRQEEPAGEGAFEVRRTPEPPARVGERR